MALVDCGADVTSDVFGTRALHVMSVVAAEECVEALLKKGANPKVSILDDLTILMH